MATSPAEYKSRILELEKLSLMSPVGAAAEDEVDSWSKLLKGAYKYWFLSGFESFLIPMGLSAAIVCRTSKLKVEPKRMQHFHLSPDEYVFLAIPFSGYVGSYGLEFALVVETTQVTQQEAECSGFLVVRAEPEQLLVAKSDAAGQSKLHATAILAAPLDRLLCARRWWAIGLGGGGAISAGHMLDGSSPWRPQLRLHPRRRVLGGRGAPLGQ